MGHNITKHFIHDVKQHCLAGLPQKEFVNKVKPALLFGTCAAFITERWWRQTGSNRRPEACKATALPTELCPPEVNDADLRSQEKLVCPVRINQQKKMVGLGGLEPPTSRLSSARSNQLSYRPMFK